MQSTFRINKEEGNPTQKDLGTAQNHPLYANTCKNSFTKKRQKRKLT